MKPNKKVGQRNGADGKQEPRWRLSSFRPISFALTCVAIYLSAAALSVVIAHAVLIVRPQSDWAVRIVAPVARGLEFLDAHWKAVLILVAPFAAPAARALVPRLRKAWGLEFDPEPVSLESEGPREKPMQAPPGESL